MTSPALTDAISTTEPTGAGPGPLTYSRVFGQARTGAAELSKASGGLVFLLARQGWTLWRNRAARIEGAKAALVAQPAPEPTAKAGNTVAKRAALIIAGVGIAALFAGGAALFRWSRSRTPPPVASAPPKLSSVKPDTEPEAGSTEPPQGPADQ